VKIHEPEFIVLYNGKAPYPDYSELKLSDAFMDVEDLKPAKDRKIPLELIVKVYNINHGHNSRILERSKTLGSYSVFIDKVRALQEEGLILAEAVRIAVKYCIENNILRGFFEANSSEVFNMLTDEWDWDEYVEVVCEEAREEGIERGIEQTARNFLAIGIAIEDVARATELPVEKICALANEQ
jgi:antitoxin component of RelBE/YafQ-DinJ toxin-antitoxin module